MKKFIVRVSYDRDFARIKNFSFDDEKTANSFFEKAAKRAERIGCGTIALFVNGGWLVKSFRI